MPTTDLIAPWTIKSFSTEMRDALTREARKEGLTVGQWMERAARRFINEGQPVVVGHGLGLDKLVGLAVDLATVPDAASNDPMIRTARRKVRAALLSLDAGAYVPPSASPPALGMVK